MKRRSVHDELYELRAAALALYQHRGPDIGWEEARRWEALRRALKLPVSEAVDRASQV